ncbi:daedalus isoform X1 [Haematobia irritans]|uniref:daedalus isoform X1 n=1 Tax=Haematobia irritans TaxID=7368 RepID=UPI003F503510
MEEHKNPFVSVNVPSVQFESNKEFQTKGLLYDGDSGFLRYRHKFIQPKGDSQANREILTTLLSTQGDNSSDYVEKLIAEDISYRDLASLTQEDLDLMGFNKRTQRELLSFFEQLPNQDPSYDQICHLNEAYSYNRKIVNNASQHLETMRSALAASNYKLQIMPPDDVIVGEKSFASRFVLEALDELYGVTDDIEKEMQEIEEVISSKNKQNSATSKSEKMLKRKFFNASYLLVPITSLGALIALCYWKIKK